MFGSGIGAAFGRAGNWSNHLTELGVITLIIGGIMTVAACIMGVGEAVTKHKFNWALPFALIAAGLALWGGWVAINL